MSFKQHKSNFHTLRKNVDEEVISRKIRLSALGSACKMSLALIIT